MKVFDNCTFKPHTKTAKKFNAMKMKACENAYLSIRNDVKEIYTKSKI